MLTDLATTSLGSLVERDTRVIAVLDGWGMDWCCGGKQTLAQACQARGIDVAEAARALGPLLEQAEAPPTWAALDLVALVDHVEQVHHTWLRSHLPPLATLMDKVLRVHGGHTPALGEIARVFGRLRSEMDDHLAREEQILFPWIRRLEQPGPRQRPPFGALAAPIRVMLLEHDAHGANLRALRELTGGFQPPEGACGSWKALYAGLLELETDVHLHVHKENDVLFPRALAHEGGAAA